MDCKNVPGYESLYDIRAQRIITFAAAFNSRCFDSQFQYSLADMPEKKKLSLKAEFCSVAQEVMKTDFHKVSDVQMKDLRTTLGRTFMYARQFLDYAYVENVSRRFNAFPSL